ncbi:winged helix-turn-helix domain-containing protein [Simiduia sp. 21SJ11W-1]|uniref:winged helix-turn-helix domain-containing protein n=1 Tax=Simiduia sp. 21SJ11W-1 TaxID=2909669 RepID=UPI00209E803E|nr:helix-turn-helix domain-containing protein [Simiduia sp. 21SJ11W-1]UTA47791.1 winged helix-turn-helix domain-containing protein [Simiduia sp. 21SJ11W-1]
MSSAGISKTQSSFYRRLYVAHLISQGVNTVPAIITHTGMPRRTAQDTINALHELDIHCQFEGPNKTGHYRVHNWGPIDANWLAANARRLATSLGYPNN